MRINGLAHVVRVEFAAGKDVCSIGSISAKRKLDILFRIAVNIISS